MSTAEYMRVWRAEHPERAREISRAANLRYSRRHPSERSAERVRYNDKLRAFILKFFGGKCVWCGATESLQMDHINGDGLEDRRHGWHLQKRAAYIRDNPEQARARFQLLCPKCNCKKRGEE